MSAPASQPALAWHARLGPRVLLGVAIIAAVSLVAVQGATQQILTHYSLTRSADDLVAARAAFARLTETRTQSASKATRLIVELPVFRTAIADADVVADAATISQMAGEYCDKLGAHFCVVASPTGRWIGHAGLEPASDITAVLDGTIQGAAKGQSASAMLTIDRHLFLVVAEPALFGTEVVGTFTAGFRFDDAIAAELAGVTNVEVSFLCGAVCGSSLSVAARQALSRALDDATTPLGQRDAPPALRRIGGLDYVGGVYSLGVAHGDMALVLLKDWTPTAQALREVRWASLWVAALALAVAIVATLIFSRRLTRPLRDLVTVADKIAGGEWTGHVPSRGPVEMRRLADAFNHMTRALGHWHQKVEARTEELAVASRRFRAITDSASDAIVSVNAAGKIVFWNPRAEAVLGYAEPEVLHRSLSLIVPEDLKFDYEGALRRVSAGETQGLGRAIETRARRRDGTDVHVELSLSTWTSGGEVFYTAIIRDMTERRQAAEAIRDREAQLRQSSKMEAVGRLAGGVAHDFNNLLTAILGYADLLLDQLPADDRSRPKVAEIQKAGRAAASLTRDLLAFSRRQVLQPTVLSLNDVIDNTDSLLRRLVGEDVQIELDLDPAIRPIRADPGQIGQVLLNLSVNARDAMPTGGRLTIRTRVQPRESEGQGGSDGVLLTVSDTGSGMTEAELAHIFEPFYTTKAVGHGTGLGLATVYGIVQQSGGRITVESAPSLGTTFAIAFPSTADALTPTESVSELKSDSRHATETVLLVEDNEAVRTMARETLAGEGYEVLEACNGAEALRLAKSRLDALAVVITDVVMPVMGGRELASHLRALRPEVDIIFTSGYASDPNTAEYARSVGAVFIQKPFVPSVLRRAVREIIDAAPLQTH